MSGTAQVFATFKELRLLVLGDAMLDRYVHGRVQRISPEAPVPVVEVLHTEDRLGGAANVALNLAGLGTRVELMSVLGPDAEAEQLQLLARQAGIGTTHCLTSPQRPTTLKTRVLGNQQQMLRLDHETTQPLTELENQVMRQRLTDALNTRPHALLLQDYDKGVLGPSLIAHALAEANRLDIPSFVDPKRRHFWDYAGCTVFKPNRKELQDALGQALDPEQPEALQRAVATLQQRMPHQHTLLTLSEHGMLLAPQQGHVLHWPAHRRRIADVSGAGDTVLAVLAAAWAAGLSPQACGALANLAGGLVCEHPGVVPIRAVELQTEVDAKRLVLG